MSYLSAFDDLIDFTIDEVDRFDGEIDRGEAVDTSGDVEIDSYEDWIRMIPGWTSLANWHRDLWTWAWAIQSGQAARHFVAIAARGGGKSSNVEYVTCMLGARRTRRYALYVRATQQQANSSVSNMASVLEDSRLGIYYPSMAERKVGKYGSSKGWTRNMIRTATGFTTVAFGLDSAIRGTKIDDFRPDFIILDDIDAKHDTPAATKKKMDIITTSILPAGSPDMVVLAVQNMIIDDGVFAKLASRRPPFLTDRVLSGPHPAIKGLTYRIDDDGPVITGGIPTWEGQGIKVCQEQMRTWGIRAFLAEAQHETDQTNDGIFSEMDFEMVTPSEIPVLEKIVCWLDPAVTSSKRSHNQAISIDGLEDVKGLEADKPQRIFRLYSWEGVDSPSAVIRRALYAAARHGASSIGIETNMGGDLWETTYEAVAKEMLDNGDIDRIPRFKSERATASTGGKEERTDQMYDEYMRGLIVHVEGGSEALETALRRFPGTPDDLVDAAYWSWKELYDIGNRRRSRRVFRVRVGNVAQLTGVTATQATEAQKINMIKRRLGLRIR